MNCKQGDMAVVIKSQAGNEGKVVTCLELMGSNPGLVQYDNGKTLLLEAIGIWWRVDRHLNQRLLFDNGMILLEEDWAPFAIDHCLMPINGIPEEVEKNEEVTSPV